MLFLLLCIALLILIVAVFYFIRLNKKKYGCNSIYRFAL